MSWAPEGDKRDVREGEDGAEVDRTVEPSTKQRDSAPTAAGKSASGKSAKSSPKDALQAGTFWTGERIRNGEALSPRW